MVTTYVSIRLRPNRSISQETADVEKLGSQEEEEEASTRREPRK